MIKKIPEEAKIWLIPGLIILGVILVSVLFLGPQIGTILAGQKEVSLQKHKLAKLTAKVAFLEGLQESELQSKTETVLAFLPAEKDLPWALTTIRNLAGNTGLELRSIQVGAGEISTGSSLIKSEKNNLDSLEFKVVVGGGWDQLKNFLSQIEEGFPLTRVAKTNISFLPPGIEATLLLNRFSLPLPTTLGASEDPVAVILPSEEEIYRQLLEIIPPGSGTPVTVSFPAGRENPFVF